MSSLAGFAKHIKNISRWLLKQHTFEENHVHDAKRRNLIAIFREELRGVLSDGASVAEEAAAQAPQEPEAGTSQGDGGAANGRKKKGKKEEKLPKKAVKKKKRRRDEVA